MRTCESPRCNGLGRPSARRLAAGRSTASADPLSAFSLPASALPSVPLSLSAPSGPDPTAGSPASSGPTRASSSDMDYALKMCRRMAATLEKIRIPSTTTIAVVI